MIRSALWRQGLTEEERERIVWPKGKKKNKKMFDKHRERAEILLEAKRVGDNREKPDTRHITIIYNPVSGGGKAKRIVAHLVEPVLKLAKVNYSVMATQYRRHAVEYVSQLGNNY